jgi:hypothetical protein
MSPVVDVFPNRDFVEKTRLFSVGGITSRKPGDRNHKRSPFPRAPLLCRIDCSISLLAVQHISTADGHIFWIQLS